ncbi:MAG TPA: hypothetical protein DIC57_01695 [Sphaerochaeta sp.]|nr:hypothetical protein [Sphaerochaeta sp.]
MRLISVLQQETGLPLFMHYCPASVVDVNTLTKTILELKANGIRTKFAILDSGFHSLSDAKAKVEQTYGNAAAQGRAIQQDIVTYRMNLILQLREYENKQVVLETEQIRFGAGVSDASMLRQKELDVMQAAFTALGTLRELEYLYVRMQLSGLLS